jgi:hypothetical protein
MFSSLAIHVVLTPLLLLLEENLEFKLWIYGLIGSSKKVID